MRRHALIVAFHFPPFAASSGVQRALRVAQYLPQFGWDCTVLTVARGAHDSIDEDSMAIVPDGVRVVRAPCLNAARHLSFAGRFPRRFAIPDRWTTWQYTGALAGLRICRRERVDLVWSTYPIATAHRLAGTIARRRGLPWVADFRDPMVQDGYPDEPALKSAFAAIEHDVAERAAAMVFTTHAAKQLYQARFPLLPAAHFNVIENGFDDEGFSDSAGPTLHAAGRRRRRVLLHSGLVYPEERNPRPLFEALARLHRSGRIHADLLLIRFRAPGSRELLLELIARHGLADMIELGDPVPHAAALQEMQQADGLLLMQADNCNTQIPAKLYEYLRAGRPILALADPLGETGARISGLGFTHGVALEDTCGIVRSLPVFLDDLDAGREHCVPAAVLGTMTRRHGVARLAALFDRIVADVDASTRAAVPGATDGGSRDRSDGLPARSALRPAVQRAAHPAARKVLP